MREGAIHHRAFLAGSSFPVVLTPFTYLGISSLLNPNSGFAFQYVVWIFPLIMGTWNVLFLGWSRKRFVESRTQAYWIGGVTLGILLPVLGNITGTPQRLFGLEGAKGLIMIPIAMVGYGLVWRYVVKWVNTILGLEPNDA